MTEEEFFEFIKAEAIKKHAEFIKEYCDQKKNCEQCAFFNGVCRFNNLPANWDMYITK